MENDVYVYKHSCIYEDKYYVYVGTGTFSSSKFALSKRSSFHRSLYNEMDVCIIDENLCRNDAIDLVNKMITGYRNEPATICLNKRLLPKQTVINYLDIINFVEYNEDSPSGLIWKNHEQKHLIGKQAGYKSEVDGYYRIKINNTMYLNHRIVYCICNKEIIEGFLQIDHIDRDRGNNRSDNLRKVSAKENSANANKKLAESGLRNISWCKTRKRWIVSWIVEKKTVSKKFNPKTMFPELEFDIAKELSKQEAIKFLNSIKKGV